MKPSEPPFLLFNFDLESYVAKYKDRNKIERLLFIEKHYSSLRSESLRLLERTLSNSADMTLYQHIMYRKKLCQTSDTSALSPSNPSAYLSQEQIQQIASTKRSLAQTHARLEQELNSYKSSLIKESIRMGHNDLGDFYYQLGDLSSALKHFAQARDYCTTDKHIIEMCLNVIKVAVHLQNFGHVANYVSKLDPISSAQTDSLLKSKLGAVLGLLLLQENSYHSAAEKFLSCKIEIGAGYNEVLHAEDIALYGGMCALATFTREELRDKVIQQSSFKAFLELVPWLREAISHVYSGKYAACLAILKERKAELQIDMYLHRHVDKLIQEIWSRAMVQYTIPYASVDLLQMARDLDIDSEKLETELVRLISIQAISARIDGHRKILYAHNPDSRQRTYEKALRVGTDYVTESRNLLLRMSLIRNRLIVRSK